MAEVPQNDAQPQAPPVIVMPELRHTERKSSGCLSSLGCLLKGAAILALIAAPFVGIWWWHPWHTESDRVLVEGGDCPEGQRGVKYVDFLVVLDVRVFESGSAVMCVDVEQQ